MCEAEIDYLELLCTATSSTVFYESLTSMSSSFLFFPTLGPCRGLSRYYVALLTYFNICKLADAELDWTPAVMAAVLPSLEAGDSALDIQRVEYERRELRRTNAALLLRSDPGPLFSVLARDAAHASDLAQALASTFLSAALTEASSGASSSARAGAPLVYPGQPPAGPARGGDPTSAASGILGQLQSRGVVQACISCISADLAKVCHLDFTPLGCPQCPPHSSCALPRYVCRRLHRLDA